MGRWEKCAGRLIGLKLADGGLDVDGWMGGWATGLEDGVVLMRKYGNKRGRGCEDAGISGLRCVEELEE